MNQPTFEAIDWRKWAELYDVLRYPPAIYEELVVERRPDDNYFKILGAWKTGCISGAGEHHAYTDKDGTSYFYSKRWRPDCPVGYRVWNDLARNYTDVVSQVPPKMASGAPDLVAQLCRRKGFGFIWAVFVLHCVRPKTFPLYDQHVYRAFRWIETKGQDNPSQAPASWSAYRCYAEWFSARAQDHGLDYWMADRALWTYGKSIKRREGRTPAERRTPGLPSFDAPSDEWVHETTFGGKRKRFWWRIERDGTVSILRLFGRRPKKTRISSDELDRLQTCMEDGAWKRLSNDVAKLHGGTEKPGIGRFLVNELGWSVTKAQLAGHLGVILTKCGVWEYNGKKAGIEHRRAQVGWRKALANYFRTCVAEAAGL